MNIVVYKGKFQYGVVDLFIDEIVKFLEKKVNEVIICDLLEENIMDKLIEIFSTKLIDCVIAFNGIGVDIKINNQSIYDVINTNFLAIFVDHPAYQLSRCIEPIKNYLSCFNDKKHVEYITELIPSNHKITFFLPQGGFLNDNKIENFIDYKKEKEIDIFFSGSFLGEDKKPWKEKEQCFSEILDKVADLLIYDDYLSVHEAFKIIFEMEKICFSTFSKIQLKKYYEQMMNYIRGYKRIFLIKKLAENDLKIILCGNNWDNFIEKLPLNIAKNIDYRKGLDIRKTLELAKRSKILINLSAILSNGSHERVFSGMLHQSVIFTDKSKYYDEYFEDKKNILYYSFKDLDKDINKLKDLLKEDEKLYNMSLEAYDIAIKNHTWENRVDKILQIIQLSKDMDA